MTHPRFTAEDFGNRQSMADVANEKLESFIGLIVRPAWKHPARDLPEPGEIVWVLRQHPKQHNPKSCELFCGEVEWSNDRDSCRINTMDFTGYGSSTHSIWQDDKREKYFGAEDDNCVAWIYARDFPLPEWTPHDKCWLD